MTEANNGYVKTALQHEVAVIEFFHPQSNSLPSFLLQQLTDAINNAGKDDAAKVIVLKSAGEKTFCAGASFNELMQIKNEAEGFVFFSGFANVINAMRQCSKFIVGRIQGKCVGGGVGLAAACDYTIASKDAAVKLSELAVGIGPFVVGPVVERKIGLSAFTQLSINAANWYISDWAFNKGLYAELHSTYIEVDEAIDKLTSTLTQSSPGAMAAIKKVLWQGTENWDTLLYERAAISGKLVLSDYTKSYIQEFKQKQKA